MILPVSVVDLFCGIGGLTKGLELAGLNVVAGLDFDQTCQYAYESNNNSKFFHKDITTITGNEISSLFPHNHIRVLVGCAPCRPFSKLTKRYRKEEKEKGRAGDTWQSDNKWKLLYSFSKIIQDILPDIISMENVPELRNEKVFADFVNTLINLDYQVSYQIVLYFVLIMAFPKIEGDWSFWHLA